MRRIPNNRCLHEKRSDSFNRAPEEFAVGDCGGAVDLGPANSGGERSAARAVGMENG